MSELPEGMEYVPMDNAVLRLSPGDILVVRCKRQISEHESKAIKDAMETLVSGKDVKVMVLGDGMELQVVRESSE